MEKKVGGRESPCSARLHRFLLTVLYTSYRRFAVSRRGASDSNCRFHCSFRFVRVTTPETEIALPPTFPLPPFSKKNHYTLYESMVVSSAPAGAVRRRKRRAEHAWEFRAGFLFYAKRAFFPLFVSVLFLLPAPRAKSRGD